MTSISWFVLALAVIPWGALQTGRARPEQRVQVRTMPGGMMLVRDVVGDYSQHPKIFLEMMAVRDTNYVAVGDCFGIYPTDPDTLESTATLRWRVGVRVAPEDAGQLKSPKAPYRLERLAAVEAAVLETNVKDAAIDGLAILRWLPENGYVQIGHTRMEYHTHEGNPMLIPARIVVPIKKRSSGLRLPPVSSPR